MLAQNEMNKISNKVNITSTKHFFFFLGRIYFTSDVKTMFVYQPASDTLELKKTRILIMFLVRNQKGYVLLNLSHYILLSYTA